MVFEWATPLEQTAHFSISFCFILFLSWGWGIQARGLLPVFDPYFLDSFYIYRIFDPHSKFSRLHKTCRNMVLFCRSSFPLLRGGHGFAFLVFEKKILKLFFLVFLTVNSLPLESIAYTRPLFFPILTVYPTLSIPTMSKYSLISFVFIFPPPIVLFF